MRFARPAAHEWLLLAIGLFLVFHYRWLFDDAFIYFRYVDNLLFLDVGLVFNDGEFVEGFSSPLHALVLVALRALQLDWMHAITLLGVACFAGFGWLVIRLNRELSPEGAVFDLPLAVFAALYGTTTFFTSGLETPLAQLMAPAIGLVLLRPRGLILTTIVAAAPLVRPELALALAGVLAFCWWRTGRFPARLFVLGLLTNGAWLVFRIVYYADLLPNTFYLKDGVRWAQGLAYLWDLTHGIPVLPIGAGLVALVVFARRRGRAAVVIAPDLRGGDAAARYAMLAIALAVACYVVRIGGAALHYWYLAFPFSLLLCAAGGVVENALARLDLSGSRAVPAMALGVALLTGLQYPPQLSAHPFWRSEEHTQIGVVSDASFHRLHPSLRPESWRGRVRIDEMQRFAPELARSGYEEVVTGTWCRTHWAQYRSRVVHGFGLTEPILARVDAPALKPGHKPALRALAEDLARARRGEHVSAAWIEANREPIETIERKLYNSHDLRENLSLAFSFPRRIALPGAANGVDGVAATPSVVIITLDTTRVDHLPDYGYSRDITPNLSALSRESVRFARAWSTSPWTLPAHASLFTGRYPASHGAHADAKGALTLEHAVGEGMGGAVHVRALHPSEVTLAELLAERGYRTGAFVGGPWLRRPFGLLQGFQYADEEVEDVRGRRADTLTDRALAWLRGVPFDAPYLLFVNYFDPHTPYDPPAGFDDLPHARDDFELEPLIDELLRGERELGPEELEVVVDRYDGEIRFMDHHLGRLLRAVEKRPGGEQVLVVVTADHGEALGEGGRWFHTYWLSEELLRVPLYVRYPDRRLAGTLENAPVQLVDVLPIVARELQLELPDSVEGMLPGGRTYAIARLYPQRFGALITPELGRGREALIEWPFKLVHVNRRGRTLYRVDGSPQQPANDPAVAARLGRRLVEARRAHRPTQGLVPRIDAETLRMLQDLGYGE